MAEQTAREERRARVTMQLGAAVYAALGVIVGEYLGASDENMGTDPARTIGLAYAQEPAADAEENDSFDPKRFSALWRAARQDAAGDAAQEYAVRPTGRAAEEEPRESGRRSVLRMGRSKNVETAEAAGAVSGSAERDGGKMPLASDETETTRDAAISAQSVSAQIERDARRYDGNFYLY